MAQTRIVLPSSARRGETIEIKTLIQHPMEPGYRRDAMGRAIPKHVISSLVVTYAGEEIIRAALTQGIAANPYLSFWTTAVETGDLVFTWTDDRGGVTSETRTLSVT
ncbi:MAG TPA: thiosulfate oxidation carrier complex protein SoxZ [Hyphomicrobiaceae bacterium]|nr:thiosulfate oxidation carrier complex protein SoxZ [Hyphomicrobiaceae bacterium]